MQVSRREFFGAALASAATAPAAEPKYRVGITTNTRGGWESDVWLSFREAREAGYENVESFIHYFVDLWDKPDELRRRMDAIGVSFVTVSNGAPMETHFEDPSRHGKLIDDHLRLGRLVRAMGCEHLKINLGGRRPEGTTSEDLKHMSAVLDRLGRALKTEGIRLAIHAHMWNQFENRREIDYVLGHTDPAHVWFVLDTGHITMAGIDPVELARALGHRIVEFHMKDTAPENRGGAKHRIERPDLMKDPCFFPLGQGGVDFLALRRHLDGIGWQGWLTVELDTSPWRPPKASARMSRNYLSNTLRIPSAAFRRRP